MTLNIAPTNWFSDVFKISDESRPVADVALSRWREKGTLAIAGAAYRVYRERALSGAFLLEGAEGALARAEKPSAFRSTFVVRHAGRDYTLRRRSVFRRAFVLLDGSREVGSVVPRSPFTRKAAVDLPSDLALPLRLFIVWLTVMSWRRDAAAGGSG